MTLNDPVISDAGETLESGAFEGSAPQWNRLAWLAAQLLDAPLAVVVLRQGNEVEVRGMWSVVDTWGSGEVTGSASAGASPLSALDAGKTVIVEDVAQHPGAAYIDSLRRLGGAACVSVPLTQQRLGVIGALCVIDRRRRIWTLRDAVILSELGRQTVTELELRELLAQTSSQSSTPRGLEVESIASKDGEDGAPGHDELTGLPNRLLLYDRLRQTLALARRYGEVLAVMHLDLDGFRRINDALGDRIGDLLLQHVAGSLAISIRDSDTLSRLRGDDFMLVLPRVGSIENATLVAAKILRGLEGTVELDGHSVPVKASIGIALYPADGEDAASLLHLAEVAMQKARATGESIFAFRHSRSRISEASPT
jgi:diguanylate cyclase (GGDEF)-like protein